MKTDWIKRNRYIGVAILIMLLTSGLSYAQQTVVKNIDTPNLSFEMGNFTNWKRYYAYFGPANFLAATNENVNVFTNSPNANPVEIKEIWTEKTNNNPIKLNNNRAGDKDISGSFEITSGSGKDPNLTNNNGCNYNLRVVPEGYTHAARVGSYKDVELLYGYNASATWYRRAMAEKLEYTFTVTENSTLLSYKFAGVLDEPAAGNVGSHFGDEHPTMSVKITAKKNGNEVVLPCNAYNANANAGNEDLITVNSGCYSTTYLANNMLYKDWAMIAYDLRDYIGATITIEAIVHDCLLELYVCNSCNSCTASGSATDKGNGVYESRCSKCNKTQKVTKRVMAGGHVGYGYITAETQPLKLITQNCPSDEYVTITAPEGFVEYEWKTSTGVSLETETGSPHIARVKRSEIQDVDYICNMYGDNRDCSHITISTRLAKDPIVMDFSNNATCFNEVSFKDLSYITPLTQSDGSVIIPDTIKTREWSYIESVNGAINNNAQRVSLSDKENFSQIFDWTANNQGKYRVFLKITTVNGCSMEIYKDIKVLPRPNIEIDGAINVCKGNSTTLTVTNLSDPKNVYTWYKGNTEIQKGNDKSLTITNVENTTYRVEIKRPEDQIECTYSKEFTTKVLENPVINAYAQGSYEKDNLTQVDICEDNTIDLKVENLTPTLSLSYTWSNLNTTGTNTVGPADTTQYTVTATSNEGCRTTDVIQVNVKRKPHLNIDGPSELCVNQEGTFKATSDITINKYVWNNDANKTGTEYIFSENRPTSASVQHIITLTGTGQNGCSSTFNKEVIVRQNPELTIPDLDPICENGNITIMAYGADYFRWNNEETDIKAPFSWIGQPTKSSYPITGFTKYNSGLVCKTETVINININKVPEIKIIGKTDICKKDEVVLIAKDTADYQYSYEQPTQYTYSWTDPKSTKTENMTAEPTSSTIYSVTVNNGNCATTKSVNITVHNDPIFTVRPTQQRVCVGATDTLIAIGQPVEYEWYKGSSVQNGAEIAQTDKGVSDSLYVTVDNDVTYTVVGISEYGCKTTMNTNIYVKPAPTLSYAGNTHICEGTQVTLTPGGADTYRWEWKKNGKDTVSNSIVLKDFPAGTDKVTYTLIGTKDGCDARLEIPVTIQESPKVKITGESSICKGEKAELVASPDGNYTINNYTWVGLNNNQASASVSPISQQIYEVIGYDATGCPGRATHTINVNENPIIIIEGDDKMCEGSTIKLTATGANKNYQWESDIDNNINSTGASLDVSITEGQYLTQTTITYTVKAENTEGCPGEGQKTITVYKKPELTINASDICRGDMVDMTVDGAATYVWNNNENITGTRFTDTNVPLNATEYTAIVRGTENGCTTTIEKTIKINERPEIKISGPLAYCEHDKITLTAQGGSEGNYRWSTGSTEDKLEIIAKSSLTDITLIGKNEHGCTNEATVSLEIMPLPNIRIEEPESKEVCKGTEIELSALGGNSYKWRNKTKNEAIDDCTNPCATIHPTIEATTTFTVEGTETHTINGEVLNCVSSAEISIIARPIPEVEISGNDAICPGSAANLTAVNQNNQAIISEWQWYIMDKDNNATQLPDNKSFINTGSLNKETKYIAKAISNSNCIGTDTTTVTLHDTVVVSIDGADYVCENGTINLTAVTVPDANDYIYNWSPQGAKQVETGNLHLTETTIFNLSITDKNSCISNAKPKKVEWIPLPKITIAQDPTGNICSGNNDVKLSITSNKEAADMDYYNWFRSNDVKINDENDNEIKSNEISFKDLTATTTIKAIGVDKYGCQSEKEIHVIEIQDAPDLTITGVTKACKGDIVQLTASSSKNAKIYWENNEEVDGPRSISLNQVGTVTFSASIEVNGCTTIKKHQIEVSDIPTVTLNSDNGKNYVCEGESLNLTAQTDGSDVSYKWNISPSTTANATIKATSSPTTASVTVTNENSCSSTASFNIEIKSNPILYINEETNGEDAICVGNKFDLNASGNDQNQYQWYTEDVNGNKTLVATGENIEKYSPTINETTKYILTGNNTFGCLGEAKFTVNTKEYPKVIAPDTTSCKGMPSTVKVTDGNADYYTWEWTEGNEKKSINGVSYSEILTETRVYQLTGTKDGCTTNPISVVAKVNELPILTIAAKHNKNEEPVVMCFNDIDTLIASGAKSYSWSKISGLTQSEEQTEEAEIIPTSVGEHIYSVSGTDDNGCTNTQEITVKVNPLPIVSISATPSICYGSETDLVVEGAESYHWSWTTNGQMEENTTDKVNKKLYATTLFNVIGTDANGCSSLPVKQVITVKDAPTLSWTPDTLSICNGENATLTINGATSIDWEDNITTGSTRTFYNLNAKDAVNGIINYSFKAWNNGCSKDTTIAVKVNSLPEITFETTSGRDKNGQRIICVNEEFTLKAVSEGSSFVWNTTESAESITKKHKNTGVVNYIVTATKKYGNTQCSNKNTYTINVVENPTIKINSEIAGDTAVCNGNQFTLSASGINGNGYTWYENGTPKAQIATGVSSYTSTATNNVSYYVEAKDENECVGNATFDVVIKENPTFDVSTKAICSGETANINLTNRSSNTQFAWSWNNGTENIENATSVSHKLEQERTYTITANKENCITQKEITVTVNALPEFTIEGKTEICNKEEVNLSVKTNDNTLYSYEWTNNSGTNISDSESISEKPNSSTIYRVNVKNNTTTCSQTKTLNITVNPLPILRIEQENAACVGNTVNLIASGADFSYKWLKESKDESGDNQNTISIPITAQSAEDTIVYVVGENQKGCIDTISYSLTKLEKPVITISGINDRCVGDGEKTIVLSGATKYTWTSEGNYVGNTFTEKLTSDKTYTVKVESGECMADTTFKVKVNNLPNVYITAENGLSKTDTTICLNDEINLVATATNCEYKWNTLETTNMIPAKATSLIAQKYNVIATDKTTKCSNKAEYVVNVNPLPNVQIQVDELAYCKDTKVELNANEIYNSYLWSADGNTKGSNKTIKYTLDKTTKFRLDVVDNNKCKNFDTIEIVAKDYPIFAVNAPAVCYDKYPTLSVDKNNSTADYYIWPDGTNNNSSWTASTSLKEEISYKVTASKNGCTVEKNVKVPLFNLPKISFEVNGKAVTGNYEVCSNDNQLSIEAKVSSDNLQNVQYNWEQGTTTSEILVTPTDKTNYSITVTDGNGCINNAIQTIIVNEPSIVTIEGVKESCEGKEFKLTATGANSYEWKVTPDNTSNYTIDGNILNYKGIQENVTFEVIGTNGKNCKSDAVSHTVTMIANPALTIIPSPDQRSVCKGSNLSLTATSGANVAIQWEGSEIGYLDYRFNAEDHGEKEVKVTATTTQGCKNDSIVKIIVNDLPTFTIKGNDFCLGTTTELKAEGNDLSFSWVGFLKNVNPVNVSKSGTYKVTGTDGNNCSRQDSIRVTAFSNPDFIITQQNISWSDDNTACKDSTITLAAQGGNYTYDWYTKENDILTEFQKSSSTIEPTITRDVTFVANATIKHNENLQCETQKEYIVKIKEAPIFELDAPTVCAGNTSRIKVKNGVNGTTYEWKWDGGSQVGGTYHEEILTANKEFIVIGTKDHCSYQVVKTAEVYELPQMSAIIGADNDVCIGDTVILSENATTNNTPLTYSWKANKDLGSIIDKESESTRVSPTQIGTRTYTVTATDNKGCNNTISKEMFVNPLPNVKVIGETEICVGQETNLTIDGGYETAWFEYDKANKKIGKELFKTINGTENGFKQKIDNVTSFYVEILDENECSNGKVVDVTLKTLPNIQLVGQTKICKGDETTISILGNSGGKNYFTNAATGEFETESVTSKVLSPTQTTTYKIRVETANNCIIDTSITIIVNPLPEITINGVKEGESIICMKDQIELQAASNTNSEFTWNNRETSETITVAPLASTQYYVEGVDNVTRCRNTATYNIVVKELPTIIIKGESYTCKDSTVTLTISNAVNNYTYVWEDNKATGKTYEPTITEDTVIRVTATDNSAQQCSSIDSFRVKVKENPEIQITNNNPFVCKGDYFTVNVGSNLASCTYKWEGTSIVNNSNTLREKLDNDKVYKVYVSKDGCTSNKVINAKVWELPTVTAELINDIKGDTICHNATAELKATANGGTYPYHYNWISNVISTEDSETIETEKLTTTNRPYSVVVEVTDDNNCKGLDTVDINVKPNPVIRIDGDKFVCDGMTGTYTATGAGVGGTYSWGSGETTESITPTIESDKTITVKGTDIYGCEGTSNPFNIAMKNLPKLMIYGDTSICEGASTKISLSGAGADEDNYLWTEGENKIYTANRTLSPNVTTTYKVTGTQNGCSADRTFTITVNKLPIININDKNNGTEAICLKEEIVLNANVDNPQDHTFLWNNNTQESSIKVTPVIDTKYSVRVTNKETNCVQVDTFEVIVNPLPEFDIIADDAVCNNSDIKVSLDPKDDNLWEKSKVIVEWAKDNSPITVQGESFTETLSKKTEYSVKATVSTTNCSDTKSKTVDVKEVPTLTINADDDVCLGKDVVLKVEGDAHTYLWPDNKRSSVKSWTDTTNHSAEKVDYKVVAINIYSVNGKNLECSTEEIESVNIRKLPNIKIDGPALVCKDEPIDLIVSEISDPSQDVTYKWNTTDNDVTAKITVKPTTTKSEYKVTATNAYGCTKDASYNLNAHDKPTFNFGGETRYCKGEDAAISILGNNVQSIVWNYVDENGTIIDGEVPTTNNIAKPTVNEDIRLKAFVTSTEGCQSEGIIDIATKELPILVPNFKDEVCVGSPFDISVSGARTWTWKDTSATTSSLIGLRIYNDTDYTVYGTTEGCTSEKVITIKTKPLPNILINDGKDTAICFNESIELKATGGVLYKWDNENQTDFEAIDKITKSPTGGVTYKVTGRGENGCENSATINVSINDLPRFDLSYIKEACDSTSVDITASNTELTYVWNNETTPSVSNTYTEKEIRKDVKGGVYGIDKNNCKNFNEYNITWKPNPKLVITGNNVCKNDQVSLNVKDTSITINYNTEFLWEGITKGANFRSEALTKDRVFRVVATKNGCSTEDSIEIKVNELPNILINDGNEYAYVCNGDSVTLNASGSDINKYTWDNKTQETGITYKVKPIKTETTYHLEGTDNLGCKNSDEIVVVITPKPDFSIIGNNLVCYGEDVILNGSDEDLNYVWTNAEGETLGNDIELSIKITRDTTLYVTGTANNANGTICSNTIPYEIKIKDGPEFTINSFDNNICYGNTVSISLSGYADNYEWYRNDTLISTKENMSDVIMANQTYFLKADRNGCDTSVSMDVFVKALPKIEITGTPEICYNETTSLKATAGLTSYSWKNLTTSGNIENNTDEIEITPKVDTEIEVTVTDNGCENKDTFKVVVNSLPSFKITPNDYVVCENSEVIITPNNEEITYKWEDETNYSAPLPKTFNMGAYPMKDTFRVIAKTNKGCTKTDSVIISTKAKPQLNIMFNDSICWGKKATMTGNNNTAKYQWYDITDDDYKDVVLSETSSYTTNELTSNRKFRSVAISNGCEADTIFEVAIREIPAVNIVNSPEITICRNAELELMANSENAIEYKWDNNSYGTNVSYIVNPIKDSTEYRLAIKDIHGCENFDTVLVLLQNKPEFNIIGKTDTCQGDMITLKASNDALNYEWRNSANTLISEGIECDITITQDTTIYITGYSNDDLKCETTIEHHVIANPYPVITVIKDTNYVCKGTQAYLEVKSDIDASYLWNTNETNRYIQKTITEESQFTVTVTSNVGGCKSDTSFVVNKWDLPIIDANDVTICYGNSAELEVTNPSESIVYRWLEASENGSKFVTPTLTSLTQYKVIGTDENSCVGEKSVVVSINPLPQFSLSSITPVCRGTETTITANDASLYYLWDGINYSSESSYSSTIEKDTTFTIGAKDNNQCENSKSIKVAVKEYPTLQFKMDIDTVCFGGSKTIYVSGAKNGYKWHDNSTKNFITIDNITETISVSVEGTTNGCTSRIDTTIKVWNLPEISIEPSLKEICFNDSVALTAQNGISGKYKWNHNGANTDDVVVIPNKVGENIYSVTGYDIHGCKNTGEVSITVNALPIVKIDGEAYVCRNENAELTASSETATSFQWIDNGTGIGNDAIFKPTISTDDSTFVVVGEDGNHCKSTAEFVVYAKEHPTLSYRTNTGKDTVCLGSPVVIYMSGADEYVWESNNSTESSYSEVINSETQFTVYGTTNGCSSDTTITISTWNLPVFGIDGDSVICLNDTAKLFTYAKDENSVLTYKWKHNGNTNETTYESPTSTKNYFATATDINNCKSEESFEVKVNPLPTDIKIEGERAVCLDSTVTLTVSGSAIDYQWGNGAVGTTIDAAIVSKDSTFYVVGTDKNGCSYKTSYKVASIEHPNLIQNAPDSVCFGSKINISIKGAAEYVWDDNSTRNYRNVEITQDTMFVVSGTSNGCTSSTTIKIGKMDLPTIKIASEDDKNSICRYDSIKLFATGGKTYTWSNKEDRENIIVNPLGNTQYIVKGIGANGCQNSDTFDLIVNDLPIVNIIGEKSICEGDDVELKAESSDKFTIVSYLWGNNKTDQTIIETITDTSYYAVTLTDSNGCQNSDSILIQSKPYPTITIEAPEYVCLGQSAIVSVEGANSYVWGGNRDKTERSFVDTPTQDTLYKVAGTTNGCTTLAEKMVEVKALPKVTITTEDSAFAICLKDSITLTANGAKTYSWNTGYTDQKIVVSPSIATEYKVIGTDEFGCQNSGVFNININKLPEFTIMGNNLICEGDVDTLWIESDENLTYLWNYHNTTSDTIYPVIEENTTFEVTATNENNCTITQSYIVRSKPYPTLEFNNPKAICYGENAVIVVSGATEYKWQDGSTNNSLIVSPENNTTYTVTGTTRGCSTTASTNINVWSLPNVVISDAKKDICINDPITLTASGASSYVWNTGDTEKTITVIPTGTTAFNVVGKDLNGCESRDTFVVEVHPLPVITIDGADAACQDSVATLIAKGGLRYMWNTNETTAAISPKINNTRTFIVIGYDEYNCKSTATKIVRKKDYPVLTYTAPTSICDGTMANISVVGASQYIWQDGSTGNSYSDSPKENTIYSVTGITENCSTKIEIPINVLSLPDVTISGMNEICINKSVTLQANGAKTYAWNTGLQSDKLTMTPMSTATYIVTGTDENNCKDTASYTVKVNPLPDVSIEGDVYACYESFINLKAIGSETNKYEWNDGTSAQTLSEIVKESKTYIVSATDTNGCVSIATHNVTKVDYPELSYQATDTICYGQLVSITASGANEYLWSNGSRTNQISDQPEGSTIYKVVGTTNGCSDSINIPIEVLPLPDLSFQGDTVVCEGNKLVLEGTGAVLYHWNTGVNNRVLEAYPTKKTVYTLSGTNEMGCSNSIKIPVKVNPKPSFEILGNDEVCKNSSIGLIASSSDSDAINYYWSTGRASYDMFETKNNVMLDVLINQHTFVYVKGIDEHGCENTASKEIKTIEPPIISYDGEVEVCEGETISLSAQGAEIYQWKHNGNIKTDSIYEFKSRANDVVTLIGTLGICSSAIDIQTRTKPSPTITITVENGSDTLCKNTVYKLTANGALEYLWNDGQTTKSISDTLNGNKNFKVEGTASNGCTATASKELKIWPLPNVKIDSIYKLGCPDKGTDVKLFAKGAKDLVWESDIYNEAIDDMSHDSLIANITEKTLFTVIGTDENGCKNSDSKIVEPDSVHPMIYEITPKTIDAVNRRVTFLGLEPKTDDWTWSTGGNELNSILIGHDKNYIYKNIDQDSFLVGIKAVASNGCVYTDTAFIHVWKDFWAPNAFTPNGDGNNDSFGFEGVEYMTEFEFTIYNRLGTVVFEGKDRYDRWDGRFKGDPCVMGVYGYVVKYRSDYKDIHKSGERRGTVTLLK